MKGPRQEEMRGNGTTGNACHKGENEKAKMKGNEAAKGQKERK